MGLLSLIARSRHERVGFELYGIAVRAARDPLFYERLHVPDTLDGQFDLVGLFVALLIRRLRALKPPGPALAQAVFDAMFSDMDQNLRELGVGDLSVPRRIRAMWEAFHGRALAYEAPLETCDEPGLARALARNVWRGQAPGDASEALARLALAQDRVLQGIDLPAFQAACVRFLPAAELLG